MMYNMVLLENEKRFWWFQARKKQMVYWDELVKIDIIRITWQQKNKPALDALHRSNLLKSHYLLKISKGTKLLYSEHRKLIYKLIHFHIFPSQKNWQAYVIID